ncbi:uncharacterized protein [Paramisgurnus dabryanus]|uniref:uncharacterized protein n=1 Tax=Paramisgurnus dabryanus TaxID=90735 RepID=UPI0031F34B09
MESEGVIEVAALGRPFQLGMLYDCRKDALVPGITLWNEEKLKLSIRSHDQINTDFKVTASDSIEVKSNLLNIEGSMKLSLLGGLINVTGAAKYLNDTKKSFIQKRLTLHYHSTTRFEQLSMNHLASENIAHHEVFDHDTATHVVTAVRYGAEACFVFDREVSLDENKTTVEGEVKAVFDKLKIITADVGANLNMNEVQKNAVQKFSVTFYGDFQLPSNPTSFEDALKVYAELPKLLGENKDQVVPLRVWLYPLSKLNSRALKLLKEISSDLISDIESALESLNTTEMKCSDLLKDSPASALTSFQNKILQMKQNCNKYKLSLMKKLGSLLPQIRGDKIEDTALIDLLKDHHESPFRESELAEWLKAREEESEIIKTLLRQLIDSGAKVENNLRAILMDLDVENVVSYTFTSLDWSDVLLPKQLTYLRSSTMRNDTDSKKETSWLTPAIHKTMRRNLEMFKSLIDSKDRKPAKFIVSSKQMEDHPGSCILLYEGGCVEAVCLTPPSQPARPITAEVKGDSVVIVIPSSCPATEELKLLYKINQEKIWTSQPVLKDQNTVTLTDLRPGTEYEIKCAAVGKLNYTTESDVIRVKTEGRNQPVVFSMESVGVNVIEVAALGRPFQLGMLYDCRKDALVPGITLWNEEKLKQSIQSRPQINLKLTDFKVTASDSIEEKSNLLNIEASMKLSLLGGLINVTGAAKYINDIKKSFIQQRLTLRFHSTTRFEELSMNHLASENIAHHEVFDHDTATHVVTAVLYGADACFVFDREVSSDENKTTVEGEVKAVYEKLKVITVDVKANLDMNDFQKNAVQKFSVTFYGDFQLPSNPTSFEDALKVYAELPKLLGGNRDLVVPLRVWLYPLSKLNSRASKLLKEISIDLISDIESALESLNTTEMKCSDLLKDSPASALTSFQNKILQMKQNCNKYKLSLMKKLGSMLPQIRGDKIEDSALIDLLKDHHESPFRESELEEWIKMREKESAIIKTLLRQLIDSGARVKDNLETNLVDVDVENVVSYTFTSLDWSDVLLPKQITYLEPSTMRNKNDPDSKKETSWLTDAIHKTMRSNLEMFKSLIDLKDRKPAKFIVSLKQMEDHPGSCILLYEGGCVEAVCFTPPSQPARPITAEVKGDSVVIVMPSSCPATEELKLLYKINQEKIWTSQPVLKDQHTVTLTDLRPGTEYEIKCAAVGKLNYTTESDVIRVKTEGRIRPFMGYCVLNCDGESSFLNALLQTLYMTKEYREHVMRLNTGDGSTEDKLIKELKVLFERLGKGQGPVSTQSTQDTVHKTFAYVWFQILRDEDDYPAECLWKILQVTRSSEIFMCDGNLDTPCYSCRTLSITGIISVTFEEFQDVEDSLQIREGHIQQFCSDCNKPLGTKHEINSQKILIVRLRRFKEGTVEKNELEVIIRPHLKISSHEFELYAIINYYGSKQSGHYNVDIKCENQQWFRFDEIQVCESFLNNLSQRNENFVYRSSSAYMLFYRPNKHIKRLSQKNLEFVVEHKPINKCSRVNRS